MEAKLTFQYDRDADILISMRTPYPGQESENLEILFFPTRLQRSDAFDLPVTAEEICGECQFDLLAGTILPTPPP